MELTEKKCAEISKKANDFIKMYKEQLENYDIRDNFLDIALDSFDNEDDMKLFKCFVIFNNPTKFLCDYKENHHDVEAVSKLYQTNNDIVNLFFGKTIYGSIQSSFPPLHLTLTQFNFTSIY